MAAGFKTAVAAGSSCFLSLPMETASWAASTAGNGGPVHGFRILTSTRPRRQIFLRLARPCALLSPPPTPPAGASSSGFARASRRSISPDPALNLKRGENGSLLPQAKLDYARQLFRVLDELTFRIWSLPGPSDPGK